MKKGTLHGILLDALFIIAGSAAVALGLVLFTIPNEIAPGGVSGLSTALASISPISVGVWSLLLNVPILAVAWRQLGFRPLVNTMAATVLLSVLIDLLTPLVAPYTNNPLLAAVLGGVLIGAGVGVLFLRGASTGGTDLVSLLLNRAFPNISVGMLLLVVDAAVVVFAVLIFKDIEVALYSIVTIFVASKTIDSIMQGVDHAKVLCVVTENGAEINRALAEELNLGVTELSAVGGYTHRDKQVLMLVVRRSAFSQALARIKAIDKKAFLFVTNASEVHGEGFKAIG